MYPLTKSLKRTNREYEAFENNEFYGRIVLDDEETVVLCKPDSNEILFEITDDHEIDLLNGNERYPVTRNEILTKKASDGDYLLYVGLDAFVKKRS